VPLSAQAIALIKALPKIDGNSYLFPGDRDKKPLSDMTLTAITRRMNETEATRRPSGLTPPTAHRLSPMVSAPPSATGRQKSGTTHEKWQSMRLPIVCLTEWKQPITGARCWNAAPP